MTAAARWEYITHLDDELLQGGVVVSEWAVCLVRHADIAFAAGAWTATVLTSWAAIETHLRAELGGEARITSFELVDRLDAPPQLQSDLHRLRKYRNAWVHIVDPMDDEDLLRHPEESDLEQEAMARLSIRLMREVLYYFQAV
jgi:hypothetical protein